MVETHRADDARWAAKVAYSRGFLGCTCCSCARESPSGFEPVRMYHQNVRWLFAAIGRMERGGGHHIANSPFLRQHLATCSAHGEARKEPKCGVVKNIGYNRLLAYELWNSAGREAGNRLDVTWNKEDLHAVTSFLLYDIRDMLKASPFNFFVCIRCLDGIHLAASRPACVAWPIVQ